MTKKYEKFEEWMVGKEVSWEGDEGVVTKRFEGEDDCVWVRWENSGELWIEIESLVFIDEAPSQSDEDKPIDWQVGQVVWDLLEGKGLVTCITHNINPIGIQFDNGKTAYAYRDGSRLCTEGVRTLFFSEPTIIADTMPPKKPFIPKLKEGDNVFIKDKQGFFGEGTVRVVHKECGDRIYISKDGDYFMKYDIASLQVIGEEIKFEEN